MAAGLGVGAGLATGAGLGLTATTGFGSVTAGSALTSGATPASGTTLAAGEPVMALSYASQRVAAAADAFSLHDLSRASEVQSVKAALQRSGTSDAGPSIYVGTFGNRAAALAVANALKAHGRAQLQSFSAADGGSHVLTLRVGEGQDPDAVLHAAWDAGASEAFFIRD